MSTADQTIERVEPRVAERRRLPRPTLQGDWWRHLVALIAVGIALFPIAYVASAAFNADSSLGGASLIPRSLTLDNFRELLSPDPAKSQLQSSTSHYARWLGNSLVIALSVALLNVLLGALAAYAFSRFRFRGRRMGLMFLLLIVVAPLMIASFAVNFNSFVTIYLLTAGGPPSEDQSIAGATDILITYTYKLAFEAGKGNDFGLASAVSIFIFMIVAAITGAAFWKSGSLENVR